MNRSERNENDMQMHEILGSLVAPMARMARTVAWWMQVANQRRALLTMDTRQLADIGISRDQAQREAHRPFWDVPPREEDSTPAAAPTRTGRGAPRPRVTGPAPHWA